MPKTTIDPALARWCEDHVVQELDCRQQGDSCGFVDDDTGFFCE